MNSQLVSDPGITAKSFSNGVIVSVLTPFNSFGVLFSKFMEKQVDGISAVDGILGVALNRTMRDRELLSLEERLKVVQLTRTALGSRKLILACVGPLSIDVEAEVAECCSAGADAVIAFPPRWRKGSGTPDFHRHIETLTKITDRLPLPIIVAVGEGRTDPNGLCPSISSLAGKSDRVIGIDIGTHNDVSHYDQAYYALKAIERPLACLPSSEAALFHNLNTGADGAISCLAFIAPHEVVALYRAVRSGCFYEAQAMHNRLAPLTALISGKDRLTREMILREIAFQRGLLPSPHARGVTSVLEAEFRTRIKDTLSAIGLQSIGDAKGDR